MASLTKLVSIIDRGSMLLVALVFQLMLPKQVHALTAIDCRTEQFADLFPTPNQQPYQEGYTEHVDRWHHCRRRGDRGNIRKIEKI